MLKGFSDRNSRYNEGLMSHQVHDCPLCGGKNFGPLLKARDFHYGNPGEFAVVQCAKCSLAVLDPMLDESEVARFYPQNYYAFVDRFSANRPSRLRNVMRSIVGTREHETKDPKFELPGKLLDVGCGSGWFLSKMRANGWDVTGVEPSLDAVKMGQTEEGLNIFPGALPDANFPSNSFDYIRFNHSFEHMTDPNQILAEVHRILADDGKLMLGIPNRSGLNAKLFGPLWWHLAVPLHPFSYSTRTISQMLEKHSFKVERVIFNTEGASIQGSLQLFFTRNDETPRTEGRISKSRLVRVLCAWAAYLQNAVRISDAIEITAIKK
jgi:SAM-dependent methyltransferase